jgi:hypothetical protein
MAATRFVSSFLLAALAALASTATTTTLASSPNPSGFGQPVTLAATVSPSTASGSVSFYDGATLLGTGALANGTATLAASTMSLGSHSLIAIYGGDTNDAVSDSAILTQNVLTATTTTLASSVNPSAYGQSVTLTATVSPSTATGVVTYYDGVTILEIEKVTGGQAALKTILLAAGSRSLRAYYGGSATVAPSSSAVLAQTVGTATAPADGFRPLAAITANCNCENENVAVADFNGDGKADFAVANVTNVSIYLGNGDGTFRPPLVVAGSSGNSQNIVVGDFNGDGKADLAVTVQQAGGVEVFLGNGDGTFRAPVTYAVANQLLALGDFNGDGIADLVVHSGILFGNGDGTFQPEVTDGIDGLAAVADFNGDGKADIAVANGTNVSIYLGNGDGTFKRPVSYTASGNITAIAAADFNGDGKPDLATVVTGYVDVSGVNILLGNGDGTFQPAVNYYAYFPSSLLAADVNGDGKADLIVDSSAPGVGVYVNVGNGDGTFQAGAFLVGGENSSAFVPAAGDFNGDGRTDLVVFNSSLSVLLGDEATQFTFTQQPVNAIAGTGMTVVAQIADASGNSITVQGTGSVTLTSNPPGISATATAESGVATFSNLVLDTAGSYTLTASSIGLASTVSNSFTISAGPAAKLVFSTQPSNGVAGTALSPAVVVQVQDQYGNVVTGSSAPVTVASIPAGASVPLNARSGVATFSTLVLTASGASALVASSSGLTSVISNAFTIAAGNASKVVIAQQPANTLFGAPTQMVVQVQDPYGNPATSSAAITVTSSPAGVSAVVGAVNGVATFSGLMFGTAGTYTLTANSPGLTPATSNSFLVAPPNTFIVSGQATVAGLGLSGATINVTGSTTTSTTANASGNYAIALGMGGAYTLAASLGVYTFSAPATFSNLSANQTANFAATPLTEVGVFRNGDAYLEDSNGNRQYDTTDANITTFIPPGGFEAGDIPVTGDWTGTGHWKVGVYRPSTGTWWLDANGDGVFDAGDFAYQFGGLAGDTPVVGDWTLVGKSCIGLFRQGFSWLLDLNCNGTYDGAPPDAFIPFGGLTNDVPVTGVWVAGQPTRIGVVRAYAPGGVVGPCTSTNASGCPFYWVYDSANPNAGSAPAAHQPAAGAYAFGGLYGDIFVNGDWLGLGYTRGGVYRQGLWILDEGLNGASNHTYDTFFGYGGITSPVVDVPITGKW